MDLKIGGMIVDEDKLAKAMKAMGKQKISKSLTLLIKKAIKIRVEKMLKESELNKVKQAQEEIETELARCMIVEGVKSQKTKDGTNVICGSRHEFYFIGPSEEQAFMKLIKNTEDKYLIKTQISVGKLQQTMNAFLTIMDTGETKKEVNKAKRMFDKYKKYLNEYKKISIQIRGAKEDATKKSKK